MPRGIVLLLALGVCLGAAGCGGDDEGKPIPAATASALQHELDTVQARIDNGTAGACKDILEGSRGPNDERVQQLIDSMPDDVDSDVRSALQDSFDKLWELVRQDCEDKAAKDESQQQQQQPEPEPEPEPTQTDTTPTQTTPTETTPTETAPPTEEQPPPEDNGNGGEGNGTGNGNGNGSGLGGGVSPGGADLGGG